MATIIPFTAGTVNGLRCQLPILFTGDGFPRPPSVEHLALLVLQLGGPSRACGGLRPGEVLMYPVLLPRVNGLWRPGPSCRVLEGTPSRQVNRPRSVGHHTEGPSAGSREG
jgi:hypothetical protein